MCHIWNPSSPGKVIGRGVSLIHPSSVCAPPSVSNGYSFQSLRWLGILRDLHHVAGGREGNVSLNFSMMCWKPIFQSPSPGQLFSSSQEINCNSRSSASPTHRLVSLRISALNVSSGTNRGFLLCLLSKRLCSNVTWVSFSTAAGAQGSPGTYLSLHPSACLRLPEDIWLWTFSLT